MSNVCSICKIESKIIKDDETILYKGQNLNVKGLSFYECPKCEEQFVDSNLDKENSILIREAKKAFDGLLSAGEIYKLRGKLKITQHEASKIFGGGLNAFSKYERGEVSQSESMDKLMRAAMHVEGLFDWLCKDADISIFKNQQLTPNHGDSKSSSFQLSELSKDFFDFEVLTIGTYTKKFTKMKISEFEAERHEIKSYKIIDHFGEQLSETSEVRH